MELSTRFPIGSRVVDFPGLDSERFGTVVEYRPMRGREGLFPVVKWEKGYSSFSSPEWGLKGSGSKLERLRERLSRDFPDCSTSKRQGRSSRLCTASWSRIFPALATKDWQL